MSSQVAKTSKDNMEKALQGLQAELKKVRTGRAQVSMLDAIKVNYYGTPTPLNQVSALSTPDARSFLISPWETSILKEIESAIVKSDLGMSPMNDGKVIRDGSLADFENSDDEFVRSFFNTQNATP